MQHGYSELRRIRILLIAFIIGLVASGITAFPIETELNWLLSLAGVGPDVKADRFTGLLNWLVTVRNGVAATNKAFPFLAYGTDWLAYAHLVIAIAFIGPVLDPIRNKWVITFGLIACVSVVPLALIAGAVRGIPLYWRCIDCMFGVVGFAVLWPCQLLIRRLDEKASSRRI